MCLNISITEILGINDRNLEIYSYPRRVREKVEYVITDMYAPYIDLTKKVFPNASVYKWTGGSTLGSYFVSAISSHYDWAMKKLKAHRKNCKNK